LVTAPITGPDPAAIVRFTPTVSGATVVSEGTIAIDPVYLPGARPRGSADTVKLVGVLPDVGLTDSQLPPVADAVKSIALPSVALMFTVCGATVPSCWGVSARVAGEAANAIGAVTVSVTGTLRAEPNDGVSKIWPVYVPGAKFPGDTVTDTLPGVVPELGVADNHPVPLAIVVETVYCVARFVLVTEIVRTADAETPEPAEAKVKDDGVAANGAAWTVRVTVNDNGAPAPCAVIDTTPL
jgi:hypothetical protein